MPIPAEGNFVDEDGKPAKDKDGKEIAPVTVEKGTPASEVKPKADPFKKYYGFDSWTDEEGEPYDFEGTITEDLTLRQAGKLQNV